MDYDLKDDFEAMGDDFDNFLRAEDYSNCNAIIDNLWDLKMFPEALGLCVKMAKARMMHNLV